MDFKSLSEDLTKKEQDSSSKLLQEKGIEHEKAYLQKLKGEGKSICEIDPNLPINDRVAKTIEALKDGAKSNLILSSNFIANWLIIKLQFGIGIVHFFLMFCIAR